MKFTIIFCLALFIFLPKLVQAGPATVTPAVVDVVVRPREEARAAITLRNPTASQIELYPTVQNLTDQGLELFKAEGNVDLAISLANWVQLDRSGIVLQPGESRVVELLVKPDFRASPGIYHAEVTFAPGPTAAQAAQRIGEAARVLLTATIPSNAREQLELRSFQPTRSIFFSLPVKFRLRVENIGNQPVRPQGSLRLYNRHGEEVAELPLNEARSVVTPGTTIEFEGQLTKMSLFPGRYRAYLRLNYGESGVIQDTVFFAMLPWRPVAGLFVFLLLVLAVGLQLWLRQRPLPNEATTV